MARTHSEEFSHLPKGVHFNKKGKVYYLRRPKQKDIRLGKTLPEALKNYWQTPEIKFEGVTVADLISRYIQEVSFSKSKDTHESNLKAAKMLLLSMGDFHPSEVSARHVRQHLDARRNSPVRANREVSFLAAVFNKAIQWGVVDESPVKDITRHKETPRDRLVTDEEVKLFKKHCPHWLKLYVDLKLMTGLRQKDMLSLNGEMIRSKGLNVITSKTGAKISFSKTDKLKLLLSKIKKQSLKVNPSWENDPKWIFFPSSFGRNYSSDGFRTAWHRAMTKALNAGELKERFCEQDLRSKAATNCASVMHACELLGHNSYTTTKRIYRRGYTEVLPAPV